MAKYFSDQVINFHKSLDPKIKLPTGVSWINPFNNTATLQAFSKFFKKFYADSNERIFLFGINPGRFGAGITGVPFTDPIRLENECGIKNSFHKRQELSSLFIYDIVEKLGGPESFFNHFYITSICPLGFIKDEKNYNYYDDKDLLKKVEPFITKNFKTQIKFGANRKIAFSLGKGKNFKYFKQWNSKYKFFDTIEPLPHPRWIMQYKLRQKHIFIEQISSSLIEALTHKD